MIQDKQQAIKFKKINRNKKYLIHCKNIDGESIVGIFNNESEAFAYIYACKGIPYN